MNTKPIWLVKFQRFIFSRILGNWYVWLGAYYMSSGANLWMIWKYYEGRYASLGRLIVAVDVHKL